MTISQILFDLHGTLVDSTRMSPCYTEQIGKVLAAQYGGEAARWVQARQRVLADWDSYFADLNFDGDDGLADFWEGELRVTRALFRLTGTPEPDMKAIADLSRELPYLAARHCDVFYEDSKEFLKQLVQAGFTLGIATHIASPQARGLLEGGGVRDYFHGPLLCPDVTGRFRKDRAFYLAAPLRPEQCLVVDDAPDGIRGAKAAGMQAIQMCRHGMPSHSPVGHPVIENWRGLLDYLSIEDR